MLKKRKDSRKSFNFSLMISLSFLLISFFLLPGPGNAFQDTDQSVLEEEYVPGEVL